MVSLYSYTGTQRNTKQRNIISGCQNMTSNAHNPSIHLGEEEWLKIIQTLPKSSIDSLLSTCKRFEESTKMTSPGNLNYYVPTNKNHAISLDNKIILTPEELTIKSVESDLSLPNIIMENELQDSILPLKRSYGIENLDYLLTDCTDSIMLEKNEPTYDNFSAALPATDAFNNLSTLASAAVALSTTNNGVSDDETKKREKRRERNRVAAAKCRLNRQNQIERLQSRVHALKDVSKELHSRLKKTEFERRSLEYNVQEHASSGCSVAQKFLQRPDLMCNIMSSSTSPCDGGSFDMTNNRNLNDHQVNYTICAESKKIMHNGSQIIDNVPFRQKNENTISIFSNDHATNNFEVKGTTNIDNIDGGFRILIDKNFDELSSIIQQLPTSLCQETRFEIDSVDNAQKKIEYCKPSSDSVQNPPYTSYKLTETEEYPRTSGSSTANPECAHCSLKLDLSPEFKELRRPCSLNLVEPRDFETVHDLDNTTKCSLANISSLFSNGSTDLSAIITPCTEKWLSTKIGKGLYSPQLAKKNANMTFHLFDDNSAMKPKESYSHGNLDLEHVQFSQVKK